ncbi:MAG: DMT family transporter [Lachnospiraceae bacterium]|nr:DMT family transporter [Lachnospiraceae bacterium]
MEAKNMLKGIVFCAIAGVTFGGQWPVAKKALQIIDPFYFTLFRYLIVAVVLSVILYMKEGKESFKFEKKGIILWFFGTMAFTAYNFLVFLGQKLIGDSGAIVGSVLMALIPLVSVLVVWCVKKKQPTRFTLINIVIAFIGVVLVVTKGNFRMFLDGSLSLLPIILMLISVIAWVIYTLGTEYFADWSSLRYTTLTCILGNISSAVIVCLCTKINYITVPSVEDMSKLILEMLYMSIVSGVIGVLAWNAGNKLLTPINGTLFMNLVPIVTFIVSVILGYQITGIEIIGSIITISALISNNMYQRNIMKNSNKCNR